MRKLSLVIILTVSHLIALLLLIDKQNRFVQATYDLQRAQKSQQELTASLHRLHKEIAQIENKEQILAYAREQNMQEIKLHQIRKIT
jgi:uncharacterized protein YxeA